MSVVERRSLYVSVFSGSVFLLLFAFAVGLVVAHYRMFPYDQVIEASRIVRSYIKYGEIVGGGRKMLAHPDASRELAKVHNSEDAMGEGFYALLGWDTHLKTYSVRLFDGSAQLAHTWPIDEMSFSDKPKHRQNSPHAMEVLADGSLIVSFDGVGLLARVDSCGKAIWSREGFYHHSFSPSHDGGLWTWLGELSAYGQDQDIVKFDPMTGSEMHRISFVDDVIGRSPEAALEFSMFTDFPFVSDEDDPQDIFHPNDVEELLPILANEFPLFDAGDLMISIRELDMVAVVSQSGELKWSQQGPWLKQHDPDFESDGRISIYNNSLLRPKSQIITVDPVTRKVTNALPKLEFPFNSERRGKHQLLPNGNRLITIPEQGQAIEVRSDGKIMVEFNNTDHANEDFNEDLVNAKWLPDGFFESFPKCD